MMARMDASITWANDQGTRSSSDYKSKAVEGFEAAKAFYEAALKRAP